MKRLYIITEGQSEQEFVNQMIAPYFATLGVYDVRAMLINTSKTGKGGFVNYLHLKNDIVHLLSSETNIIVTTFVDYFRIPTSMPDYEKCIRNTAPVYDKVACLEKALADEVSDRRFIPYIQVHEFEAVLFSSNAGFEAYYDEIEYKQTQQIIDKYENPELINGGAKTSPSNRILKIIPEYKKIVDGNLIALEVGMKMILTKCPKFKGWLKELEGIMTE